MSCDRRWKEYFPSGRVAMGDSERAHLDSCWFRGGALQAEPFSATLLPVPGTCVFIIWERWRQI